MSVTMSEAVPPAVGFSDWPVRFVARVTLELTSAIVVRASSLSASAPTDFVRDANGLPALPGTSLCGALRHAYGDYLRSTGRSATDADHQTAVIFGASGDVDGSASRFSISWGRIHDGENHVIDGLFGPEDPRLLCPVLLNARQGARRDRVRINQRGTADGLGKFEDLVISAGHRFTFDMGLRGDVQDNGVWQSLLDFLCDPDIRLGAGTRHGLGAIRVHRLGAKAFNLRQYSDYEAFCRLPVGLGREADLPDVATRAHGKRQRIVAVLKGLRPTTPWVFGGGIPEAEEATAPVAEAMILWDGDRGAPSSQPLQFIPATSVKGVLAHRLAWHYNRLTGYRVVPGQRLDIRNEAVATLLGFVAPDSNAEAASQREAKAQGRRGMLMLGDIVLREPASTQVVHHVSLDRFSGGARNGMLFSERVLTTDSLSYDYEITLLPPPEPEAVAKPIRHALAATLEDVRKGRLAFGAGTGRGNGRFQCDGVEWSDGGQWIDRGLRTNQHNEESSHG